MDNERKKHLLNYLSKGIRFDGRKITDYRKINIETGISKNAEGSARVTLGGTVVIAGVKMAVEKPYPDTPEEGTIMVNAELLPLSSPDFEGGPPNIQAIELARVVDRGIRESKVIDFKKLCIEKGEKVWVVMIDLITINDEGNLFDAFALAAVAAIKDAKMPKFDGTTVDYKIKTKTGIPLKKSLPVSVTVLKIGDFFIVDPLSDEEEAVEARLTVSTLDNGNICALQKGGELALDSEQLAKMLELATQKAKELRKLLP